MKYVIGIGGVTNGGKTTLTNRLIKSLPNCCVVHQDDFFRKPDHIEVGADGFRQWDVITALDMDAMANTIRGWAENPVKFACSHGVNVSPATEVADPDQLVHILIVEGFLLFNYKSLMDVYNKCYYISIPYEECKRRRSTRQYTVPDPPGLFDGHVWPMYLKHRKEMVESCLAISVYILIFCLSVSVLEFKLCSYVDILVVLGSSDLFSGKCPDPCLHSATAYLDGLKSKEELYSQVYEDIQNTLLNRL